MQCFFAIFVASPFQKIKNSNYEVFPIFDEEDKIEDEVTILQDDIKKRMNSNFEVLEVSTIGFKVKQYNQRKGTLQMNNNFDITSIVNEIIEGEQILKNYIREDAISYVLKIKTRHQEILALEIPGTVKQINTVTNEQLQERVLHYINLLRIKLSAKKGEQ